MSKAHDRDLGMNREITRRDFVNGVGVALTGSLLTPRWLEGLELPTSPERRAQQGAHYPPALTGMRGSHAGSFEVAHQLREGRDWDDLGPDGDTGESYDLVVVGGGLSGLAAAYFFLGSAGRDARVLVLDNHDDFGGHAKRNEFRHNGRLLMLNGGTLNLEAPSQFSAVASTLLRDLGIDIERFETITAADRGAYRELGLGRGFFFDQETFGEDRLVAGLPGGGGAAAGAAWREWLARTPFSEAARRDIARLEDAGANRDHMPGLSDREKKDRLARMSYQDFLLEVAGVDPGVIPFYQTRTHGLFAMGIDGVSALQCWNMGYPGFQGMNLEPSPLVGPLSHVGGGQHGRERELEERAIHFPDGNATLARLLVRGLIPEACPGSTMEDVVTARLDYGRLDQARSPARIRLGSTVVQVRHLGSPESAEEVEVTYVRDGQGRKVRAGHCILACWNEIIPYICPEMPDHQKEALAYGVKLPIVYTNVLIRNWTSFANLGVRSVSSPGMYHYSASLAESVSIGEYRAPVSPEEPMVVHMNRTPNKPGASRKEQYLAGRHDLLATSFETFEREIREQLGRMLSGGGFDPARDIEAITVNRWPHGYTYNYSTLWDPMEWALFAPDDRPNVIGRKPVGRISIGSCDSAASSHTDAGIDEAHRAVGEVLLSRARGRWSESATSP